MLFSKEDTRRPNAPTSAHLPACARDGRKQTTRSYGAPAGMAAGGKGERSANEARVLKVLGVHHFCYRLVSSLRRFGGRLRPFFLQLKQCSAKAVAWLGNTTGRQITYGDLTATNEGGNARLAQTVPSLYFRNDVLPVHSSILTAYRYFGKRFFGP